MSVLIPVILGIIGALAIVCLAFGIKMCQTSSGKIKQAVAIVSKMKLTTKQLY